MGLGPIWVNSVEINLVESQQPMKARGNEGLWKLARIIRVGNVHIHQVTMDIVVEQLSTSMLSISSCINSC